MANVDLRLSPPYTAQEVDLRNFFGGKDAEKTGEESEYVLYPPGSPIAPLSLRAEGRTVIRDVPEDLAMALRTDPSLRFYVVGSPEEKEAESMEVRMRPARVPVSEAHHFAGVLPLVTAATPGGPEIAPAFPRPKEEVRREAKAETQAAKDAAKDAGGSEG